jgi:hypothetical protein
MPEKTNLRPNSSLLSVRGLDLETVTKFVNGHLASKFKGLENATALLRIRQREHVQSSVPDQRVFIHVQRKNKHPHSTKKHK